MSLSLGTAAVGFLLGNPTLYGVMRLGDRFERWCTCAWSSRSLMPTTGNRDPHGTEWSEFVLNAVFERRRVRLAGRNGPTLIRRRVLRSRVLGRV